jgi:hypothetical protein
MTKVNSITLILFGVTLVAQSAFAGVKPDNHVVASQLIPVAAQIEVLPGKQSIVGICESIGEIDSAVSAILVELPNPKDKNYYSYFDIDEDLSLLSDTVEDIREDCLAKDVTLFALQSDVQAGLPTVKSAIEDAQQQINDLLK